MCASALAFGNRFGNRAVAKCLICKVGLLPSVSFWYLRGIGERWVRQDSDEEDEGEGCDKGLGVVLGAVGKARLV